MKKIYIAEIAGKDSISSVINFVQGKDNIIIVPTVVYTGTEYGDINTYNESIEFLKNYLSKRSIKSEETLFLHDEKLWNILNAKYQYLIFQRFGFFTPCIMCHFYTHLMRIPLYLQYKASGLITGERFSHDGKIKMNQHPDTLECFFCLFKKYGINLIRPNCDICSKQDIDDIINDKYIIDHANDVKCVLSGNLYGFPCENNTAVLKLNSFIKDFVEPIGNFCIGNILQNDEVDLIQLEKLMEGIFHE